MENTEKHSVQLEERNDLIMTGVNEVLSFDDTFIEVSLESSNLSVDGDELRIIEFDSEKRRLSVTGRVSALTYYDESAKKSGGFFKKRRG